MSGKRKKKGAHLLPYNSFFSSVSSHQDMPGFWIPGHSNETGTSAGQEVQAQWGSPVSSTSNHQLQTESAFTGEARMLGAFSPRLRTSVWWVHSPWMFTSLSIALQDPEVGHRRPPYFPPESCQLRRTESQYLSNNSYTSTHVSLTEK